MERKKEEEMSAEVSKKRRWKTAVIERMEHTGKVSARKGNGQQVYPTKWRIELVARDNAT